MFKVLKKKLAYQLTLNIALIILSLIGILVLIAGVYMHHAIEQQFLMRMASQQELVATQIEGLFDNTSSRVRQMGMDNTIRSYLQAVSNREQVVSDSGYQQVLSVLKGYQKSDEMVFLTWVANERANFYLDSQGVVPDLSYDVKARPWYQVAVDARGEVAFTPPYLEWGTNKVVLSSIQALYDKDKRFGFVVIDFKLDVLPEFISAIDVGLWGNTYVVDRNGQFIYHQDDSKILNRSIKEDSDIVWQYFQEFNKGLATKNTINIDGVNYYICINSMPRTGWSIISIVSQQEVMAVVYAYLGYAILLLFALAFVVMFVVYTVTTKKLEPVKALNSYAAHIADGEFDKDPPFVYAKRIDEMGDMARSFITITEVFRQKNVQLQEIVSAQYDEIQQQYHYILEKEKIASLGTLVAGVAHEINTPLGVSVTTASYIHDLLETVKADYEEKKLTEKEFNLQLLTLIEAASLLDTNLKRSADLVQQFKSIATNQNVENLAFINLHNEIEQVIASLKPNYKHRPVRIENNCDNFLQITTYPGAITQIFTNLIMNALDHAFDHPSGDDFVGIIRIEGRADGELVRIQFSDNGRGINNIDLAHVFEPFYTSRRDKGNSGLGLYITQNLVAVGLSGTISVESSLGLGTIIHMVIPMHLKPN